MHAYLHPGLSRRITILWRREDVRAGIERHDRHFGALHLGHELVQLYPAGQRDRPIPRVVVVGGVSAERVGRAILRRSPETAIVLLVADPDVGGVRRGLAWGATAVIDIAAPARKVAATVTMLCNGDVVILPRSASSLLTHFSGARSLSADQVYVLRLLASHLTVAEMALLTHRSQRSMQRDLTRLYRTLAVDGRRGALAVAHEIGVLEN
jgi:DNA-binding NarL/FixJ family response regulator